MTTVLKWVTLEDLKCITSKEMQNRIELKNVRKLWTFANVEHFLRENLNS